MAAGLDELDVLFISIATFILGPLVTSTATLSDDRNTILLLLLQD